jgi:hypothetical protein
MRKPIYLIFLIAVFLMGSGNLRAADLKDGFFDIKWTTNLSEISGFKKVGENLNVSFFANPARVYTIDNIKIPDAVYGSFANQFFAVYINIETIEVFAQLRRHINRKYGLPKMSMSMPNQHTTYQWKQKKTKIKLKIYENKDSMKMAFYYTPLSAQVNEAQQETFQENFRRPWIPLDDSRMQKAIDLIDLKNF